MPRYTEAQARDAVAASHSYAEALRRIGLRAAGGNHALFRKYVDEVWRIDTSHFDPYWSARRSGFKRERKPLDEILVEESTYDRATLKARLFEEALKRPICELCGQGEIWRGRRMALILDHINGVPDDNRLENLRIVCPNCAATLETHCARKNRLPPVFRPCVRCGKEFVVKWPNHRYCSPQCGSRWDRRAAAARGRGPRGRPKPSMRTVKRPPYEQLVRAIEKTSYLAVGRKYGVADNAVRKWVRWYERQAEREAAEREAAEREAAEREVVSAEAPERQPPEALDEAA